LDCVRSGIEKLQDRDGGLGETARDADIEPKKFKVGPMMKDRAAP
jgi:hypothetical protein